ncbi:hypothetical protein ACJX0J_018592 [Zea mays]
MYIMYITRVTSKHEVDVPFAHKLGSAHSSQFDFLIQIQQYPVKKEIWKLYHNKYGDLSCCLRSLSSKSISKIVVGTIRNLSNRVISKDVVNIFVQKRVQVNQLTCLDFLTSYHVTESLEHSWSNITIQWTREAFLLKRKQIPREQIEYGNGFFHGDVEANT